MPRFIITLPRRLALTVAVNWIVTIIKVLANNYCKQLMPSFLLTSDLSQQIGTNKSAEGGYRDSRLGSMWAGGSSCSDRIILILSQRGAGGISGEEFENNL